MVGFDAALRLSAHCSRGGYHHHLGLNTWAGSYDRLADTVGLSYFTVVLPRADVDRAALLARAHTAGNGRRILTAARCCATATAMRW
ncbi:MAG: hypothetical protein U0452_12035 [Anaerolineae bacterium]